MTPTTEAPQKGGVIETPGGQRQYRTHIIEFARRLHEQNGWSAHRIRKALMGRGYSPSHDSVQAWIDPEYEEIRRERRRLKGPSNAKRRLRGHERRLLRMEAAREVGLSHEAIRKLVKLDYGLDLTRYQVESILRRKVSDRTIRRLLWPQGAKS